MDPVQEQLAAYNAHDAERFAACYAPDVVLESGDGRLIARGREELRSLYAQMFKEFPSVHCRLLQRLRVGSYVIDEEHITGRGPEPIHAVVAYTVVGDLIVHGRIYR